MLRIFALLIILFSGNLRSQELVILHTNDIHSRVKPMSKNSSFSPNKRGFARQAAYIKEVRSENPLDLVLNSGDIVQGTYFNVFKGEAEIALMNAIEYDAACIENHKFDNGLTVLAEMIRKANFPFISSNYDFENTLFKGLTKEYTIIKLGDLKIGMIGIGVDPEGLIAHSNYQGMEYLPPVETANKWAKYLKEKKKCDLAICLSHLGYFPKEDEMGNITLNRKRRNIDIILGAHSHILLEKPVSILNADGKEVVISQMDKNGIFTGRMDVNFEKH